MSGTKSENTLKLGENVIIAGLVVQILFFGFFVLVSVVFHRRITLRPTSASLDTLVNWKRYLLVLYFASVVVMVRCIYRVAEYIQGQSGALQSHEYLDYMFDALLMFQVMLTFIVFHPSKVVPSGNGKTDDAEMMYRQLSG